MSKKKTVRPPDPLALARAIVDGKGAAPRSLEDFMGGTEDDSIFAEGGGFERLVESTRLARNPKILKADTDSLWSKLDEGGEAGIQSWHVLTTMLASYANAGFLVGLELGRRLGGAR